MREIKMRVGISEYKKIYSTMNRERLKSFRVLEEIGNAELYNHLFF